MNKRSLDDLIYILIFSILIILIYLIWDHKAVFLILSSFLILELVTQFLVKKYAIPNGVIASIKIPKISESIVNKFVDHGFDSELGWVRKANTKKIDSGLTYKIDNLGSRNNPCPEHYETKISTFGDSYCFCREVSDNHTWQSYLTDLTNTKVLNYGVGNYGFDQALLRLKREYPGIKTEYVVMAIVPHTIARILSVWKHYNEFGNILAFKPRFYLKDNELVLLKNFISSPQKFYELETFIDKVNLHDFYYESKFLKESFSFPYLFSVIKNPRRILYFILKLFRKLFKRFPSFVGLLDKAIIETLDSEGPKQLKDLYQSNYATSLLLALMDDFFKYSKDQSFIPIILFLPMKEDLLYMQQHDNFYSHIIDEVSHKNIVIDLSEKMLEEEDILLLFNKWHYSKKGNQIVAKTLLDCISKLKLNKAISNT